MSRYLPSLETFAKGTAATVATLSTLSAGLLYYGQNYLIYPSAFINVGPPGFDEVDTPELYGLHWEDLELKTSDDILLRCYLLPQRKELPTPTRFEHIGITPMNYRDDETDEEFMARRPTVVMFHGNGGNLGHRIPLAMVFQQFLRLNVLMVSYRGYGKSTGSPSEKGLRIDAQTALDFLASDSRFSKQPIILFGQSIGGAVSIDLASRNPRQITALILENTFTSLPELVPHVLPLLGPFTFLCHQKWDSASKVPLIPATTPVLLLSGLQDELVPPEHMKRLRDIFEKQGKAKDGVHQGKRRTTWLELPDGDHNNTASKKGYWHAVEDFVRGHVMDLVDPDKSSYETSRFA